MNDFERNVWCLLGIPIDAVTFEEAIGAVESAVAERKRCFFSTPNLNFVVEANKTVSFRNSLIHSDLVLIDGMPPLWVARMLGIPGIEKVSGSDLVENLWHQPLREEGKIRVFLFGGEAGIGERACERINAGSTALECTGSLNPGFGTVEEMSNKGILKQINDAQADFVIVALGAQKGQAWILANKDKLHAPVISHLGAVINFTAGAVARAPRWVQQIGAEWLWRIGQEPALWQRYFFDGISFMGILVYRVLPYVWWRLTHRALLAGSHAVSYHIDRQAEVTVVYLDGACLHRTIGTLRPLFAQLAVNGGDVKLDLKKVPAIDGAFLGLCLLLRRRLDERVGRLTFSGLDDSLYRLFRWNMAEFLL